MENIRIHQIQTVSKKLGGEATTKKKHTHKKNTKSRGEKSIGEGTEMMTSWEKCLR